jgi:hypothetical protein
MSTKKKGQFVPLRNVPIHMDVEGVTVVGAILTLSPSDITVVITEPFSGFRTYVLQQRPLRTLARNSRPTA